MKDGAAQFVSPEIIRSERLLAINQPSAHPLIKYEQLSHFLCDASIKIKKIYLLQSELMSDLFERMC